MNPAFFKVFWTRKSSGYFYLIQNQIDNVKQIAI